jgi:hypothetical protein
LTPQQRGLQARIDAKLCDPESPASSNSRLV